MAVVVSLLRGINVGGRNRVEMSKLRELYESLKLRDVQTYIQSGNVLFRTGNTDLAKLANRIEIAIEKAFGFRPGVMLRTVSELKTVAASNPFAAREGIVARKLLVMFLAGNPSAEARKRLLSIKTDPEELHLAGREVFIYYPNGMAWPKISWALIEKKLETSATARNWNSVARLIEMAEQMEAGTTNMRE